MDQYEALQQTIALSAGAAWASGINLYAVLLVLGIGGVTGYVELPESLALLENPLVIAAAALMYCVEFFADKIPGVDTVWDALHSFVRIPAGALLAAGAMGEMHPALTLAAGILGGGMAAATHATKSSTRMVINSSPEPFSNWGASIGEDLLVLGGLWAALHHPLGFLIFLILFFFALAWLLPRIWGLLKALLNNIAIVFGFKKHAEPPLEQAYVKTPTRPVSPTELVAALERLHKLKERGALEESEFLKQKQVLLRDFM